ncbi:hypothetical protein MTR67_051256 [Solanum verrucosum]|uniref:Uncharacterized protein n=1 Tax=Solanum verrucosum TaxID=315347 RepID=A0AAF0ZZZ2_SOLVR|nr:hypothetical protein MTR67_051256 [Solanum verrucosum]
MALGRDLRFWVWSLYMFCWKKKKMYRGLGQFGIILVLGLGYFLELLCSNVGCEWVDC